MKFTKVLLIKSNSEIPVLETILLSHPFEVVTVLEQNFDFKSISQDIQPDVVLIYSEKVTSVTLKLLMNINQHDAHPIILFSDDSGTDSVDKVIKAGVSAYIICGVESKRIQPIIDIAIARFKEQQQLKKELEKTKSKLEDHKFIDRAKALLIKSRGLTEDQAYHTLRKLAMDQKVSISEIAKNVISMADLFL